MRKKTDLGIILASLVFILLAHKPLALGMMYIVDQIGVDNMKIVFLLGVILAIEIFVECRFFSGEDIRNDHWYSN